MIPLYDALLVLVISGQLFLTPFTKVEESFNIQAIHDIIYHGTSLDAYDHLEFSGAVPRTFVGSLVIAAITKAIILLFPPTASKFNGKLIARGVLGVINAFGILNLKNAVVLQIKKNSKSFKEKVEKKKIIKVEEFHNDWSLSLWFAILTFTQFHITYYSSRTLPNFIALPLTNFAFAKLIRGSYGTSISILAITAVLFRIEIVALLLSVGFFLFLFKKQKIWDLIRFSLIGGSFGLLLSFVIDSVFWKRFTIPELESFIFNVIEGKSSEWGTEPLTKYFSKYLLTLYLPPIVPLLALLGFKFNTTGNNTLCISFLSVLLYVIILSFQPHKEWRFLAYVIPVINVIGANGASYISSKASKSLFYKLLVLIILACASLTALINVAWTMVSSFNYPGGYALNKFHGIIIEKVMNSTNDYIPLNPITVHFDTAATMTGVTKFDEFHEVSGLNITYDKTEDPNVLPSLWKTFDYIISEIDLEKYKGDREIPTLKEWSWRKLDTVEGFAGINIKGLNYLMLRKVLFNVFKQKSLIPITRVIKSFIKLETSLYIYERIPHKNTDNTIQGVLDKVEVISESIEESFLDEKKKLKPKVS